MSIDTTHKLYEVDAATVARVTKNHRAFIDARHSPESVPYASWAGVFEVNIEELLEIIDRLTGQAPEPEPMATIIDESQVLPEDGPPYRCAACNAQLIPTVNDYGRARMFHAPADEMRCTSPTAGWYRDRPEQDPSGLGWPA